MGRRSKKEKLAASKGWSNLELRVMAEYGSSGIWVIGQRGVWRHGMIEHASLKLPDDLSQRFEQWINLYLARLDDTPFDTNSFNRTGRSLAIELKLYLGAEVHVEFIPESDEANGLGAAEEIQPSTKT